MRDSIVNGDPEEAIARGVAIGVRLNPAFPMIPQKSLSMVIGIGREVREDGILCDFCNLRETCRHRQR